MRMSRVLPAGLILLAAIGPAFADTSCHEEVTTLERRLDSAGAAKVTGKEPSGGTTSSNSPKALDKAPNVKASDADVKPTSGGVDEARALLAQARQKDQAGDAEGCRDTILKAKEKAGALP